MKREKAKFLYPFFESDDRSAGNESGLSPAAMTFPTPESTPQSCKASSGSMAKVDKKDDLSKKKSPRCDSREPADQQAGSQAEGKGSKKTMALVRIKDKIKRVEVQYSPSNRHVSTIDGQPARKALYGFLGEESKLQRLKSDQDIVLADSKGDAGYCQGCKDLKVTSHLYRWIDHKLWCKAIQSRLEDELAEQGNPRREVESRLRSTRVTCPGSDTDVDALSLAKEARVCRRCEDTMCIIHTLFELCQRSRCPVLGKYEELLNRLSDYVVDNDGQISKPVQARRHHPISPYSTRTPSNTPSIITRRTGKRKAYLTSESDEDGDSELVPSHNKKPRGNGQ